MGKTGGFLEYERQDLPAIPCAERVKNYNEFHISLDEEARSKQAARCMECGVPYCQYGEMLGGMASGCPLHNLIPEWNDLVYRKNYEMAAERLLKTSSFPEFTSRVCPALCEKACTCGLNGDPVSTKDNEHAIIEYAFAKGLMKPETDIQRTDKKVAVIGSGPAGLACADTLNKRGHNVTVFEKHDRLGGLLMYGIPNMKLEKQIIDRRTSLMAAEGVCFKTNENVDSETKANKILKGFDAVVLACGAQHARDIKAPGRDAKGIMFAVDFLTETTKALLDNGLTKDYTSAKDKNVVIIGGGDTGNDCCGTSIRHGAKSVLQVEMMPKPPVDRLPSNPWPEWPKILKTDYGQEEAIHFFGKDPRVYNTTVKEFIKDDAGNLKKVMLVELKWEPGDNGRMKMSEIEGSEYEADCDLLLIAAGFLGVNTQVSDAFKLGLTPRTNILADSEEYKTNVEKVFATGDCRRGQSLVVWAIHEGREAAKAVDKYLMGYTNIE